jgi:NAD-dependent deacetylase
MALQDDILRVGRWIADARRVSALTGAGVSKESGIPTFRDALDGIWAQYDPTQLATPEAFAANPARVWDFYQTRRENLGDKQPNPGHVALAQLETLVPDWALITQNIDDLHERAGSQRVIRLHGRLTATKCSAGCQGDPTLLDGSALDPDARPPRCPHCGSFARPDVVWFGEALPADAIRAAQDAAAHAQVMLVIGTSGLVTPAADLPYLAQSRGAKIVEVNPLRTPLTSLADVWLAGASGEVLPRLLKAVCDALA